MEAAMAAMLIIYRKDTWTIPTEYINLIFIISDLACTTRKLNSSIYVRSSINEMQYKGTSSFTTHRPDHAARK